MSVRGIRNNNPGNIRIGAPWQGLMARGDMTAIQRSEREFCVFETPVYGIRAIARVLITYQDKRQARDGSSIDTVQEIIDRWAPPSENNTDAYVRSVRVGIGADPDQTAFIDVHRYEHLEPLVKAIIRHENGSQPYTQAQIDAGLRLAGVTKPATAAIGQGRTMTGVKAGAAFSVAGLVAEAAQDLNPAMPVLQLLGEWLPYAVGVILLGVLLRIGWARLDDWRRGLR